MTNTGIIIRSFFIAFFLQFFFTAFYWWDIKWVFKLGEWRPEERLGFIAILAASMLVVFILHKLYEDDFMGY